ncbi:MAG: glycosyltransferase family 2 protein [Bacteroidota bacterium]
MNLPLISVIVPCYNQSVYLKETLDSVLAQTHTKWECIIVNDGSTDETEIIANTYCIKDKRFIYIRKVNGGLSSARNAGLKLATGEYIQFLDSDDLIREDKFEIQLSSLTENNADVLVSNHNLFIENLKNTFENHFSNATYNFTQEGFLYQWNVDFVIAIHSGLFSRKFLIDNEILFDETVKAREDWIFWCTLAINNATFSHQDFKLAHYRVHKGSMTNDRNRMLVSLFVSTFVVQELLPETMKVEYRNNIAKILLDKVSIEFGNSENAQKANSIDYKIGYIILFPFHRVSGIIKKIIRKFLK